MMTPEKLKRMESGDAWAEKKGLGIPFRVFPCCEVAGRARAGDKCWCCGEGEAYEAIDLNPKNQLRRLLPLTF